MLLLIDTAKEVIDTQAEGIGELPQILKRWRPLTGLKMRNSGGLESCFGGEIDLAETTRFTGSTEAVLKFFGHENFWLKRDIRSRI